MRFQIPVVTTLIRYYRIFQQYTGRKVLLLLAITIGAGLFESIGIVLFMPLLSQAQPTAVPADKVSLFFRQIFDLFGLTVSVNMLLVIILIVFVLKAVVKLFEGAFCAHLTSGIIRSLRVRIISKTSGMHYRHYLDTNPGFLANLVTLEASRAVISFTRYCIVLSAIVTIAVYLVFSFWINWILTLLTVLFGAVTVYLFKNISRRTKHYSMSTSREYGSLNNMLIQSLHAFKYMKSTNGFEPLRQKLFRSIDTIAGLQFRTQFLGTLISALTEPLVVLFAVAIIFYQVSLLHASLASLLVSIMFFYRIAQSMVGLQRRWQEFSVYVGGMETLTNADADLTAHGEELLAGPPVTFRQSVRFQDVSFSYNQKEILQSISFEIPKNATIAFVGESGAGKTTLVDLITGLLQPQKGLVFVDDKPLVDIDIRRWRSRVGYVTQEPVLFNDSAANNISLWGGVQDDPECLSKVRTAALQAHCDQFVDGLPDGFATIIGDKGVKLSGGQRQRLAIARELYKKPDLLILDEATSALDTESELYIQQSIDELKGQMTMVIIAHRLSTVRCADYIYVLKDGCIIERGSFSDLLERDDSSFRKMCDLQNLL